MALPTLFVIGATGPTGKLVLRQALDRGHRVVALARTPAKLASISHPLLEVVAGDLYNLASMEAALQDKRVDVVIFVAGVSVNEDGTKPTTVYSDGARNTLSAMKLAKVQRLVFVTSAGLVGPLPGAIDKLSGPFPANLVYRYVIKPFRLREVYIDMQYAESILKQELENQSSEFALDLTVVRPGWLQGLPHGNQSGQLELADGRRMDYDWFMTYREDLAQCLIEIACCAGNKVKVAKLVIDDNDDERKSVQAEEKENTGSDEGNGKGSSWSQLGRKRRGAPVEVTALSAVPLWRVVVS